MRKFIKRNKKCIVLFLIILIVLTCGPLSLLINRSLRYNKPVGHETLDDEILKFPEDFLWGAATASYQVEGGNLYSNWWRFEQIEGNIKNGDRTEVAIDHYHKFKEDFDLVKELNLDSYRFSIEWARVEPEKGKFDDEEMEHYREVIGALHDRGIKPMVTLWHHSFPAWFEDQGGWEKQDSINDYVEYVEYVVEKLNDDVELWITMNEPMAYIACGYISAKWPPAKRDVSKVPILFSNITKAHKKAYKAIHKIDSEAKVGIAEHSSYVVPFHPNNIIENVTAYVIDYAWTHHLLEKVSDELDFVGLHYYYKQSINLSLVKDVLTKSPEEIENKSLDRAYFPQGLFEVLLKFKRYDKPIYITEIGVPDYHEIDRDQFIEEHAREIYYAIEAGVDVQAFYYWALLDSFEWTEGYDAKFGLIAVDMETLERTIKEESWVYGEIAKCNCVVND